MGELFFSELKEIASKEKLTSWFDYQAKQQKPLYYLLPSVKWFQHARKLQPGISFQTFDDLALLLLQSANVEFTPISEEDRVMLFYEIVNRTEQHVSEKELAQKAQAYADSYGQLKRLGLKVEETPQPLERLKKAFSIYEQEYRDQNMLLDPENRIFKAIETNVVPFPLSHVVIDGFFDFSPVQYLFIEHLVTASVPCTVYLPNIDTMLISETVAGLRRIGVKVANDKQSEPNTVCHTTNVTAATTIEEEIHGVLETIAMQKGNGGYNQFGIVLANEKAYLPVLERISEQRRVPLKIPKKMLLSETNFISFLHHLLNNKELRSKWDQLPLVDTIAKLCFLSPIEFTKVKEAFIQTRETNNHVLSEVLEGSKLFMKQLPVEEKVSTYLKNLLRYLENTSLPDIWRKEILEKNTSTLNQVAKELRAFQRVKEFVKESVDIHPLLDVTVKLETFTTRLIQILSEASLYLDRKPTDGIELFSFRDVPLFQGTHVFVLGMNEGEFPKQTTLNGYFQERYLEGILKPYPLPLSDYFRKKDDAAFAQLHFIAENLSFSYVEGMNPHQPLLPSKYVMEMDSKNSTYSTMSRLTSDTYLSEDEYEAKVAYQVGIGKALKQELPVLHHYRNNLKHVESGVEIISSKWAGVLKTGQTSITRLESYATCAFRFGLEKYLKVSDPLEKQYKIDPIETGKMLHRIIERFYQEAKGIPFQDIRSFFKGKDEETLEAIFEEEWELVKHKHPELAMTTIAREKDEWWKKLKRWLTAERSRFWDNNELANMMIFKMEEPVEFTIDLDNNETLTLTGKIDRIDIDEHGFVIYDYKSSEKELDFNNEVPAGVMLQIPLYMIALEHEFTAGKYQSQQSKKPIGGGYISIKAPHLRKKNTVWKNDEHKKRFEPNNRIKPHILTIDSDTLLREYQFPKLIEKLWRGSYSDFSVKPFSAESCRYCSLKAVCRVTREQQDF